MAPFSSMTMTADVLALCLALAATGLVLLVLALRTLLRSVRKQKGKPTSKLTAAVVVTGGLIWIDVVILWCLFEYAVLAIDVSSEGLRALIDGAGAWAPLASIGLMTAHSFVPFPAELIAVANGVAFGPWLGVLITWLGAMTGAVLSYELVRVLGPVARARLIPSRLQSWLDDAALDVGIKSLLIARLIPVISFNLINYMAGLAGVPRWRFIWTTGVGILPLTVVSVLLGSEALELPAYVWIAAGVSILVILGLGRAFRSRHPVA